MQPHSPYLGERADQLRERVANKYDVNFRYMQLLDDSKQTDGEHIGSLLSALENGYISHDEFVGVYKENLQIALRYVKELLDRIEGKTVITADHSESFGDFNGIYAHDNYALSRDLREVPWFVIDESRRETFSEQPIETKHISDESVRENLRDLGYL
jgi:hypothetical protein